MMFSVIIFRFITEKNIKTSFIWCSFAVFIACLHWFFVCVIIRVVGTTKYCLAIRLGFNDKSKYSDKARTKTKYTTKDTRKQTYK